LYVLSSQGVRFSFGAFINSWQNDFSTNRGTISDISLLSFLVFAITQPIVGNLIDKLGIKKMFLISTFIVGISTILTLFATSVWQLFILYGFIASLGFGGASGVTASVAVTKWFHKKQGFALGLIEAAFGAGQMIIVPSSIFLIQAFGWKWTVLILGILLLFVVIPILAIFLKSAPSDVGLTALAYEVILDEKPKPNKEESMNNKYLYDRKFWFLLLPFCIC
jgi:MFS family permease